MANKRICRFQQDWLLEPQFKFLKGCPDKPHIAVCTLCTKTIDLSNMGRRALSSHVEGQKHKAKMLARSSSGSIRLFTTVAAGSQGSSSREPHRDVENPSEDPDDPEGEVGGVAAVSNSEASTSTSHAHSPATVYSLDKYLTKDDVTAAEIIWCLQAVLNHTSISAAAKAVELFPKMFPDSKIAASMQLSRHKMAYVLVYGLAPYFHDDCLVSDIKSSDCFVIYFDESLNKFVQRQQMDLAIRFWRKDKNEVCTRYLSSAFLGHSTATDLLEAFLNELKSLDLRKLLHVSMDGPNVNFKFIKDLEAYLREKHDVHDPIMLLMGSCGLHVLHNSFKTGAKATEWMIVPLLRAAYNVFKDVPSRRSDYILYSKSHIFPLKFCAVRWLNNGVAADRAKNILPNLKKYIDGNKAHKKVITSASYRILEDGVNDKLMGAKLAFFSYVAGIVEPFLTQFQSDAPMAPFLHTDLTALMAELMGIFVKPDVLKQTIDVTKIDLTKKENLVTAKNVKLGFSVKAELRKVDVKDIDMLKFKNDCLVMAKTMCEKLLEKSPLKYQLCKAITFCDPSLIQSSDETCIRRLESTLNKMMERNWYSGNQCDNILKEFKAIISKLEVQELIKGYDRKKQQLDHFWSGIILSNDCSELFQTFIQRVLLISHGNAFVERGFSINKEMMVENQAERSLVAQRQVYDGVKAAGGISFLEINRKMISKARYARHEYAEALKCDKRKEGENEKESFEKKRLIDQIQDLKSKRMRIVMEKQAETAAIDDQIAKLTRGDH